MTEQLVAIDGWRETMEFGDAQRCKLVSPGDTNSSGDEMTGGT